ncbi:Fur family transcriptional regulator [Clostridium hydrogenum]|uniref:Fur family transcriptional regulator n=1 Tax=Clostridium hydrogenum TaxID=2855764 RepID=UPI001F17EDDB|nr:Fur family transcriptional regulator [Clostridium hydrogenum]
MENDLIMFKNLLLQNGYKFTSSRKHILKAILNSGTHLSAKEICEKVKEYHLGLATVYRALKLFNKLGIVKEITLSDRSYYELKLFSKNPLHIHFKCFKCNSIIDIDSQDLNLDYLKLSKKAETENNVEIYDSNIMFVGLCSKCKGEVKCQDEQNLEE